MRSLSQSSFLPRVIILGLLGSVPIGMACGGKTVGLGTTGDSNDKLSKLDTTNVAAQTSNVGACPAGFAHPNICCEATASADPTCGAWENDPFRACDAGWATYPNALSCCSLSDPTKCIDTPVDAGIAPPPPYGCGFTCPPGWYENTAPIPVASGSLISSGPSFSCCRTAADGSGECFGGGGGYATPVACTTGYTGPTSGGGYYDEDAGYYPVMLADGGGYYDEDAGTYTDEDGGVFVGPAPDDAGYYPYPPDDDAGYYPITTCDDGGSGYPAGYDGGVASLCNACPAGWTPDAVDPVLCCQLAANGVRECFSQASGSAGGSFSDDAGAPYAGEADATTVVGISDPIPTDAAPSFSGH